MLQITNFAQETLCSSFAAAMAFYWKHLLCFHDFEMTIWQKAYCLGKAPLHLRSILNVKFLVF